MQSTQSAIDFCVEIEIGAPRAQLRDFLCDLHNYAQLHPLIESIQELGPDPSRPGARRFRVVDRIGIGPLRFRTRYEASLEAVGDAEVHGFARQWPGVRLHSVYRLHDAGDATRVVERVSVKAPRGLRRFVIAQARRAHEVTLARMRTLLETPHDPRSGTRADPPR